MNERSTGPDFVGHDAVDVVGQEPVRMPRWGGRYWRSL